MGTIRIAIAALATTATLAAIGTALTVPTAQADPGKNTTVTKTVGLGPVRIRSGVNLKPYREEVIASAVEWHRAQTHIMWADTVRPYRAMLFVDPVGDIDCASRKPFDGSGVKEVRFTIRFSDRTGRDIKRGTVAIKCQEGSGNWKPRHVRFPKAQTRYLYPGKHGNDVRMTITVKMIHTVGPDGVEDMSRILSGPA